MSSNEYVFNQGMRATRSTLQAWGERPWPVLRGWLALSISIACSLLAATWICTHLFTPDLTPVQIPGMNGLDFEEITPILQRNALVLALHGTACVAGFIAGASMPVAAAQRTGFSRWIHLRAGEGAIIFVSAVTIVSLSTQALALGFQGGTIATQLDIPRWALILSVLPHALLELTALFLPLAAWLIASRRGEWNQLLAATITTVAIAIPCILVAAMIEVTLWPRLLEMLSPVV